MVVVEPAGVEDVGESALTLAVRAAFAWLRDSILFHAVLWTI
jgi:hypothetical protein